MFISVAIFCKSPWSIMIMAKAENWNDSLCMVNLCCLKSVEPIPSVTAKPVSCVIGTISRRPFDKLRFGAYHEIICVSND